jgi:hypothetical protein
MTNTRDATHGAPGGPAARRYDGGEASRCTEHRLYSDTLRVEAEVARHLFAIDVGGPRLRDVEEVAQGWRCQPVRRRYS